MPRNPIARALPAYRQRIVQDKRDRTLRQLYDDTIREEVPDDIKRLIDRLD